MLLTRPSLLKTAKLKTSAINSAGPIVSAILSDARAWYVTILNQIHIGYFDQTNHNTAEFSIDYALQLINSATTMLFVSLPPKRSSMPLYV